MLLAAVQSWFAWPELFNDLPPALRASALALVAAHSFSCLRFTLRNGLLCLRNVEYSQEELAAIFEVCLGLRIGLGLGLGLGLG